MAKSTRTIDFNLISPDDPKIRVIKGQKGKTEFRALAPKKLLLRIAELSDGSFTREWATRYVDGSGAHRRHRYGLWPEMTFAQAAAAHIEAMRLLGTGGDPASDKVEKKRALAARETVRTAVDQYLSENHNGLVSGTTLKEYARLFEKHLIPSLGDEALADIDKERWSAFFRDERRKFRARDQARVEKAAEKGKEVAPRKGVLITRLFWAISSLLTWASLETVGIIKESHLPPPERMGFAKEKGKPRPMDDREISLFWNEIDATRMEKGTRCALKLILLTALRPAELLSIRKRDISLAETWVDKRSGAPVDRGGGMLRIRRTKRQEALRVPLSPPARAIVQEAITAAGLGAAGPDAPLFPNKGRPGAPMEVAVLSKALRRNLSRFDFDPSKPPVTPHKLRATAADLARQLDFDPAVVSALLNHTDHSVAGRHYSEWDSINQRADAANAIAKRIETLSIQARAKTGVVNA